MNLDQMLPQCLKTNLVDYMANPAKAPQVFKEDPIEPNSEKKPRKHFHETSPLTRKNKGSEAS